MGRYDFLSNYFEYSFSIDGKDWHSVEHYYQAQKFAGRPMEERVRLCKTPAEANNYNNAVVQEYFAEFSDLSLEEIKERLPAYWSWPGLRSLRWLHSSGMSLILLAALELLKRPKAIAHLWK